MQQKTFGRRPQSSVQGELTRVRKTFSDAPAASVAAVFAPPFEKTVDVDAEVAHWNELRKARKRSFREPWRTASIVCGVGFGLSYWLLPDQVANIAELLSGGLSVAALVAGLRVPRTVTETQASAAD